MERHHERRTPISPILFLLLTLTFFITSAGQAQAGTIITGCTSFCHGMPPKDGNRKGSPHFKSLSSAVKGNHQTHLTANPTANSCPSCHGIFSAYTSSGHQNNRIEMSSNIHTSPSAATYSRGIFFNQTTVPPLGTCSNVNCHFTTLTPNWGGILFSFTNSTTNNCNACHGAPPATNNHTKHFQAFGANTTACAKCHSDHTTEAARFQHATSAGIGHRNLSVTFAGAPTGTGMYTGVGRTAYPNYLPGGTGAYAGCSGTYCHGSATPTWGDPPLFCNSCHGASNNGDLSVGTTAGHAIHYNSATVFKNISGSDTHSSTAYAYGCKNCHPTTSHANGPTSVISSAEIGGSKLTVGQYIPGTAQTDPKSFKYTNGSCSNNSCHNNGLGGNALVTAAWNGVKTANCGACHNKPGDATPVWSAPHKAKHFNTTITTPLTCRSCHGGTALDNTTINGATGRNQHPNGVKDVAFFFNGFLRTTWSGNASQCTNVYCHGDGTSITSPTPATISAAITLPIDCTGCHTGGTTTGPTYANGTPKANSHAKHVVTFGATCNNCHNDVTTTGTSIAFPANHINEAYNIQAGGGSSYAPTPGTPLVASSCSSISCHSNANATWGTKVNCKDCHLNLSGPDQDDLALLPFVFWNNGTVSKVGNTEWTTRGHGATTAYASGNPGAGFIAANACEYCHDYNIGHKVAANPFRLKNYADNDPTWGLNKVCMNCHAVASTGVTIDGVPKNGTKKVGAFHHGTAHLPGFEGGRFCWDCHDGHGDNNAYMIHQTVYKNSIAATGIPDTASPLGIPQFSSISVPPVWGDFVKPTFNGVCQVCHGAPLPHFNIITYDTTHNPGTSCITSTCHSHNGTGTVNSAFSPPAGVAHSVPYDNHNADVVAAGGNAACLGCHVMGTVAVPGIYPATVAGSAPNCMGCHTKAPPVHTGTVVGANCSSCHGLSTATGTNIGRPNTDPGIFPDNLKSHNAVSTHTNAACTVCHVLGASGGSGSGVNHGRGSTPGPVRDGKPGVVTPFTTGINVTGGSKGVAPAVTCNHNATLGGGCGNGNGTQTW